MAALNASLLAWPASAGVPCGMEQGSFRGWNAFSLTNGIVSIQVAPDIGGRVIQFQLAGHPYFFVNADLAGKVFPPEENGGRNGGWKNYGGSKLWPAPQGWETDQQWPGPPDPVLDGGRYRATMTTSRPDEVAVTVTSPEDERTGIQFSRTVRLFAGSSRVRHDCAMKNASHRPVRWAIWEVTQHDTSDPVAPANFNNDFWAYTPLNRSSAHPKGFSPLFGQATHASWLPNYARGLFAVKYDYRVGKVGLDSPDGWLAVANGKSDHCFVARFAYFPEASYPDGSTVEFWLNGAGEFILNGSALTNAADPKETPYFMESEILAPLVTLQPGEDYHFQIDWFATRCPRPIVEVTSAGAVHAPLTVRRNSEWLRVEGTFGVFFRGHAELIAKDNLGNPVAQENLGRVDPNEVFRVNKAIRAAPSAYRVSLRIVDEDGRDRGTLGHAFVSERIE
ncbi:MAG: DUF4380 domain-containing protein [Verrucomicrobia bacterium]|nr:DUF4380 domain-containing protein [Verrucomicrobiota bacterium]